MQFSSNSHAEVFVVSFGSAQFESFPAKISILIHIKVNNRDFLNLQPQGMTLESE